MRLLSILILAISLIDCKAPKHSEVPPPFQQKRLVPPLDWKLVDACTAKFYIPTDGKRNKVQGIDSCVAEFENKELILSIDALTIDGVIETHSSWKSYSQNRKNYQFEDFEIGGQHAEIITFEDEDAEKKEGRFKDFRYVALLHVSQMRIDGGYFTMRIQAKTPEQLENAIRVFHSLRFN